MRIIFLFAFVLVQAISFGQKNIPNGRLAEDKIINEYVIYFLDDDILTSDQATSQLKKNYPKLEIKDWIQDLEDVRGFQALVNEVNVGIMVSPPDLEYLEYSSVGLTEKEKNDLQKSKKALVLDFFFEKEQLYSALKITNEAIHNLVKNKNVVIFDSETGESFSKEAWKETRLFEKNDVNIANHIVIHLYQKDQFCRAITLGMSKFGLPDIVMENLSCHSGSSFYNIINLTAQTLLEKYDINENWELKLDIVKIKNKELKSFFLSTCYDNAKKKAPITFITGTSEQGDPENRLIEISFEGDNPQIAHDELISTLFGSVDEIALVTHNERILEASERAKSRIPELKKMFQEGLPLDTHLLVKFPFEYGPDQREWMWIEVTKWTENSVSGLLQNDPVYVKDLKSGQKVSKDIRDMFDYMIYKPDGSYEGNETGKIMMEGKK